MNCLDKINHEIANQFGRANLVIRKDISIYDCQDNSTSDLQVNTTDYQVDTPDHQVITTDQQVNTTDQQVNTTDQQVNTSNSAVYQHAGRVHSKPSKH